MYQTGLCSRPIYKEALILVCMYVCVCVCVCMLCVVLHACMDQCTPKGELCYYVRIRSKPQAAEASIAVHAILMSASISP